MGDLNTLSLVQHRQTLPSLGMSFVFDVNIFCAFGWLATVKLVPALPPTCSNLHTFPVGRDSALLPLDDFSRLWQLQLSQSETAKVF